MRQQVFVGGGALQYQAGIEVFRQPFGAVRIVFDNFDVVEVFHLLGQAVADVAAAGNHHAAGALLQRPQFAHHGFDVAAVGEKEYFVAFDNYRFRRRYNQAVVAVNRADLAVHAVGQVFAHQRNRLIDQKPAIVRLHHGHPRLVVGKTQHLQCAGVAQQRSHALGNQLFGVDGIGNSKGLQYEAFFLVAEFQIVAQAHAGDAVRNVEQVGGNSAGGEVGFVVPRQGQQHVAVVCARRLQDAGRCAVADDGLHVQPRADVAQRVFVGIDDGYVVVGHGRQILRHGGTDLAAAENDDFHVIRSAGKRRHYKPKR